MFEVRKHPLRFPFKIGYKAISSVFITQIQTAYAFVNELKLRTIGKGLIYVQLRGKMVESDGGKRFYNSFFH
jgi:hypothetical protein